MGSKQFYKMFYWSLDLSQRYSGFRKHTVCNVGCVFFVFAFKKCNKHNVFLHFSDGTSKLLSLSLQLICFLRSEVTTPMSNSANQQYRVWYVVKKIPLLHLVTP